MTTIPAQFKLDIEPSARPEAVVRIGNFRFSVLTSRLIRMEYSPNGCFEDRASQVFWYRNQAVPEFSQSSGGGDFRLETGDLLLEFLNCESATGFDGLRIKIKETGLEWRYGMSARGNLLGTTRTLDTVSGSTKLEQGLLSRDGWALVDDSKTLVFNSEGWLEPRQSPPEQVDQYFFGHGHDFQTCLNDYYLIAGKPGMVPRWVLGNWWSRYWRYSHAELLGLMRQFKQHQVPLSVCIIDMDWHITDTGNRSRGWTGYTWNKALFPDPHATLAELHELELKVALNLHPADGVYPHETQYAEFARRMGIDSATKEPVPFNCANPDYMNAYFDLLHHPYEQQGVDFWWIDWQQGESSDMPGLDPLWWLNHLHYYDLARDRERRSFIFSRWGGLGNHRYPIGFSGDTEVTWESLAFQPFFTATAANVGYGWWSHDIGGHMGGIEDPELYARWVQYGVFSPILRLHSTNNPFHDRTPWGHDAETAKAAGDAMRLRHALIPYIYSMAWGEQQSGQPFIRPMYHDFPDREEAYACPQQYLYGGGLIAAPYTSPADLDTGLSRQVIWLPDGDWYQVFTGEYYPGDRWYALYGRLEEIPVFARAGAILPLGADPTRDGVHLPESLVIKVFPGADGEFVLFEDDGISNDYKQGEYVETLIRQEWLEDELTIILSAAEGRRELLPEKRQITFELVNVKAPEQLEVTLAGKKIDAAHSHDNSSETLIIGPVEVGISSELKMVVRRNGGLASRADRLEQKLFSMLKTFRMNSWEKKHLFEGILKNRGDFNYLRKYAGDKMAVSQLRLLFETLRGAGVHQVNCTSAEAFWVLWNNQADPGLRYRFEHWPEHWHMWYDFPFEEDLGVAPSFKLIKPDALQFRGNFRLRVDYDEYFTISEEG